MVSQHTMLEVLDSLSRAPLRTCRSMHHCCICRQDITLGQRYRDRGYGRRCHLSCLNDVAEDLKRAMESVPEEEPCK